MTSFCPCIDTRTTHRRFLLAYIDRLAYLIDQSFLLIIQHKLRTVSFLRLDYCEIIEIVQ
jgi:hypothetical protein